MQGLKQNLLSHEHKVYAEDGNEDTKTSTYPTGSPQQESSLGKEKVVTVYGEDGYLNMDESVLQTLKYNEYGMEHMKLQHKDQLLKHVESFHPSPFSGVSQHHLTTKSYTPSSMVLVIDGITLTTSRHTEDLETLLVFFFFVCVCVCLFLFHVFFSFFFIIIKNHIGVSSDSHASSYSLSCIS